MDLKDSQIIRKIISNSIKEFQKMEGFKEFIIFGETTTHRIKQDTEIEDNQKIGEFNIAETQLLPSYITYKRHYKRLFRNVYTIDCINVEKIESFMVVFKKDKEPKGFSRVYNLK